MSENSSTKISFFVLHPLNFGVNIVKFVDSETIWVDQLLDILIIFLLTVSPSTSKPDKKLEGSDLTGY